MVCLELSGLKRLSGASSTSSGTWSPTAVPIWGERVPPLVELAPPPALGRVPPLVELGPRYRQDPYKFHHWWNLLRTIGAPPRSMQVPPVVELAAERVWCLGGGVFWGVCWRSFFGVFVECVVCVVVLLRGGVLCCSVLLWGWCFGIVGLWCFWSLVLLVSGGKGSLELMVL